MTARGCQDLFNFTRMDAGSAELYSSTAAKVCRRSAKELLKETFSACGSPSLETSVGDRRGAAAEDRVLDIGCGTGETTRLLLDAWPHATEVLGVDKSGLFLEYARADCTYDGRLAFATLDADEDVWPTNWESRFTKVFSNYALHWIKDHRKLMANVARALAPGGELIAQFFHSTSHSSEMAAAKMAAEELGCGTLLQQFLGGRRVEQDWKNPDNYSNLLTSLGLSVRRCAVTERTVRLESRLERAGMALSVNPLVGLLPESVRSRFAVAYTENLRDPYTITHNVVALHAVKCATAAPANGSA